MLPLGQFLLKNVGRKPLLEIFNKTFTILQVIDVINNVDTPRDNWQLSQEVPRGIEEGLSTFWHESVMSALPRPHCITCNELLHVVLQLFFEDETRGKSIRTDYEQMLNEYLSRLDKIPLTEKASAPFVATQAAVAARDEQDVLYGFPPLVLFQNDFAASIVLDSILHAGFGKHASGTEFLVYLRVGGPFTTDAIAETIDETKKVVGTLIQLASMLDHSILETKLDIESKTGFLDWGRKLKDNSNLIPVLYYAGELGTNFQFIPPALNAYWSRPPKKDVVSRRIRNAINLLSSAYSLHDDAAAIQLALAVAAIESLVCQRGANISSQFSDHVASLLEPDPHLRGTAVKFMRKLYDARSSVLHGADFDATLAQQGDAKLIAAACLQAMVERREFTLRMEGTEETGKSLVDELSADRFTPGRLTGVGDQTYTLPWQR